MARNRKFVSPHPASFVRLEENFYVAGCLDEEDLERAALAGYETLINILPEDDELCRLRDSRARKVCKRLGLAYHHLPVYGHQLDDRQLCADFAALLAQSEGKVLAWCRTGTRCAFLWGIAKARQLGADEVLTRAARKGYDLMVMEDLIRETENRPLPETGKHKAA